MCFLQFLMGRHFIIENSGASRIFKESPLQCLEALGLHVSKLDQCMYGAEQEQVRIRKSSMFVSDFPRRDWTRAATRAMDINIFEDKDQKDHAQRPRHGTRPSCVTVSLTASLHQGGPRSRMGGG